MLFSAKNHFPTQNLLSDAMILEDVVKDFVGGEEVFSEDGVDGGEGAAEVFGDEVGGEAGAHGGEDVA